MNYKELVLEIYPMAYIELTEDYYLDLCIGNIKREIIWFLDCRDLEGSYNKIENLLWKKGWEYIEIQIQNKLAK